MLAQGSPQGPFITGAGAAAGAAGAGAGAAGAWIGSWTTMNPPGSLATGARGAWARAMAPQKTKVTSAAAHLVGIAESFPIEIPSHIGLRCSTSADEVGFSARNTPEAVSIGRRASVAQLHPGHFDAKKNQTTTEHTERESIVRSFPCVPCIRFD
jgi:hypothetical protein